MQIRTVFVIVFVATVFSALVQAAPAEAQAKPAEAQAKPAEAQAKPPKKIEAPAAPPLPLHMIEGTSGIFITQMAYIANPPELRKWLAMPSLSASYVKVGHKDVRALGLTYAVHERIELGYAYERLDLGHWPQDVEKALGLHMRPREVDLHTMSLRTMLVKEGQWEQKWIPAITAGVHYKYNADIKEINRDLQGTCRTLGYRNNDGWDATLVASKTFANILPKPFILSAGLRSTRAALTGFTGFSGDRDINFEGSAAFFITDKLLFAGEYRQKRSNWTGVRRLVEKEDDWWLLAFVYVVNEDLTLTAGYLYAGDMLNHRNQGGLGFQVKWEF